MTGLIDAAQSDAPGARDFNKAVDEMLARTNPVDNAARIRSMINGWRSAEIDLQALVESSPALSEAKQLAADFRTLNQIALEALDSLEKHSPHTAEWRDSRLKMLDQIAKPKAAVELVTDPGVRKLVNAAAGT